MELEDNIRLKRHRIQHKQFIIKKNTVNALFWK